MAMNSPWYRQQRCRLEHHWGHHSFLLRGCPSPESTLSSKSLRQSRGQSVICQSMIISQVRHINCRTFSSCVKLASFFLARNLLFLGTATSWNGLPTGENSVSGVVLVSMLSAGEALGSMSRSKGPPPTAIEESEVMMAELGVRGLGLGIRSLNG